MAKVTVTRQGPAFFLETAAGKTIPMDKEELQDLVSQAMKMLLEEPVAALKDIFTSLTAGLSLNKPS